MRLTTSVRARPSSSRRSTSSRSATVMSSATTWRRRELRRPATATLCASTGSVLRPWPVSNTRTRADNFGGTSRTVSPSATRRWATCRADPGAALNGPHPVGELAAGREHLLVAVGVGAEAALELELLASVDDFDRGRPLVRIHPDHHTTHRVASPRSYTVEDGEEGNATSSRAYPLEPLPAAVTGGRTPNESHTLMPWTAEMRATRRPPRPSLARLRS